MSAAPGFRVTFFRALAFALVTAATLASAGAARAGESHVVEAMLPRLLPAGLEAGVQDPFLPVWPILKDGQKIGYVFESNQLVDLPGFSGTPIDLLVALDTQGVFIDVRVLDQTEPVFVHGLGPQPLFDFVKQYRGKSIRDGIRVADAHAEGERRDGANGYLDGVTKATASVRIVNETVLASALKVARAKLAGIAAGPPARLKPAPYRPMSWANLLESGLVRHLRLTNAQVDAAFAGTPFAALDTETTGAPDAAFIDMFVAPLDLPVVAENLFAAPGLRLLAQRLGDGDHHAVAVMAAGPHGLVGPDFVPGAVADRLHLRQGDFPVDLRDTDADLVTQPGVPRFDDLRVFKMDARLGFDAAQPWTMALRVARQRGLFYPETASRDFTLAYAVPEAYLDLPPAPPPAWVASWRGNARVLAALSAFLGLLTLALALPRHATRQAARFAWGRRTALAVTVGFVGWFAQGQLSIITVLAVVKAARTTRDLSFLLYDPISLTLWAYVLGTLLVWGRGTFCGWLCPFGAMQDFAAQLAQALRLPQWRLSPRLERHLPHLRYGVLAALVGGTLAAPSLAETLAEAEPFKTAVTLAFQRDWPMVAYAAATLGLGLVVFKGYCRFLCPLGGALALASRLRRWPWIARRAQCGTPCQLCARRCRYGAIARDGAIVYHDCFQCLDCVAIHADPKTCVPLVLEARRTERMQGAAP